jgi:hypothetical protein
VLTEFITVLIHHRIDLAIITARIRPLIATRDQVKQAQAQALAVWYTFERSQSGL